MRDKYVRAYVKEIPIAIILSDSEAIDLEVYNDV